MHLAVMFAIIMTGASIFFFLCVPVVTWLISDPGFDFVRQMHPRAELATIFSLSAIYTSMPFAWAEKRYFRIMERRDTDAEPGDDTGAAARADR